ncbi:MAG TPA: hypothetical protein VFP67_14070 [Acidimicrobiia bacterium]|nr:hypothetical protein [Acidimicrobiia bacterium]
MHHQGGVGNRQRLGVGNQDSSSLAEEASERYCALTTPDLYHLFTVELGWTAEHHREWLARLM